MSGATLLDNGLLDNNTNTSSTRATKTTFSNSNSSSSLTVSNVTRNPSREKALPSIRGSSNIAIYKHTRDSTILEPLKKKRRLLPANNIVDVTPAEERIDIARQNLADTSTDIDCSSVIAVVVGQNSAISLKNRKRKRSRSSSSVTVDESSSRTSGESVAELSNLGGFLSLCHKNNMANWSSSSDNSGDLGSQPSWISSYGDGGSWASEWGHHNNWNGSSSYTTRRSYNGSDRSSRSSNYSRNGNTRSNRSNNWSSQRRYSQHSRRASREGPSESALSSGSGINPAVQQHGFNISNTMTIGDTIINGQSGQQHNIPENQPLNREINVDSNINRDSASTGLMPVVATVDISGSQSTNNSFFGTEIIPRRVPSYHHFDHPDEILNNSFFSEGEHWLEDEPVGVQNPHHYENYNSAQSLNNHMSNTSNYSSNPALNNSMSDSNTSSRRDESGLLAASSDRDNNNSSRDNIVPSMLSGRDSSHVESSHSDREQMLRKKYFNPHQNNYPYYTTHGGGSQQGGPSQQDNINIAPFKKFNKHSSLPFGNDNHPDDDGFDDSDDKGFFGGDGGGDDPPGNNSGTLNKGAKKRENRKKKLQNPWDLLRTFDHYDGFDRRELILLLLQTLSNLGFSGHTLKLLEKEAGMILISI